MLLKKCRGIPLHLDPDPVSDADRLIPGGSRNRPFVSAADPRTQFHSGRNRPTARRHFQCSSTADSRILAFCPQTASWLTSGASVLPPDFTQFIALFTEYHSLLTIFLFRATTDCTIFVLRCRGFWSICSVDLRCFPWRHANHHHLEPQGPGAELRAQHYNHHVGPTSEHPDHIQRGLQPRWGVHLQGHKSCRLGHLFS